MTDTANDDMTLTNPGGREVTVPNDLGQELLTQGFTPSNGVAKKAAKATVESDAKSSDNPAFVTEKAKVTPPADVAHGETTEPAPASTMGEGEDPKPRSRSDK